MKEIVKPFNTWLVHKGTIYEERLLAKETALRDKKAENKKLIRNELAKHPKVEAFLKEENVEGKFVKNLSKELMNYDQPALRLEQIFREEHDVINNAFTWNHQKEGYYYWGEKHEKLKKRL